jgi:hypothetical protein
MPTPSSEVSNLSPVQIQNSTKGNYLSASTSSSANIMCHHCKGMGHVLKDCPSRYAYIATVVGQRYESASDVQEEFVLATNLVTYVIEKEEDAIDSLVASGYKSLFV